MRRRIILAGGGHAHLAVLADWARRPLPGTRRWLVTPARHMAYSGMVPGWMAGLYRAEDLLIDLEPLARRAGAELVLAEVAGLDPAARRLQLPSGAVLDFDLLSLATGGETDCAGLAALGDRLLPVRPLGRFMARWPSFLDCHAGAAGLHVAVLGGGAAGVELALGAAAAMRGLRDARVSLVTAREGFLSGHAPKVRAAALDALARGAVGVHFARATGARDGLVLSGGGLLAADLVIAATGSRAPGWLAQTGLACSAEGFVAVGADLRSLSHGHVLAAGDIAERVDRKLERSGVHAVKAGPVLAANLRAALAGGPLRPYRPRSRTLYLLALGGRRAILSWGGLAAVGGWVWRIKDRIDRGFVRRYTDQQIALSRKGEPS